MEQQDKAPSSQQGNKRQRVDEFVERAKRNGYMLETPEVPQQARDYYRHWCKQERRCMVSWVQFKGEYEDLLEARHQALRAEAHVVRSAEPAWKSALALASERDAPPAPVAVPEHLPALLSEEQICAFLGLPARTAERAGSRVRSRQQPIRGRTYAMQLGRSTFDKMSKVGPHDLREKGES